MWDRWNITAAAPLLRMQIDTLVRVSYVARRDRTADRLAGDFLSAERFSHLRDEEEDRPTDKRLVELAGEVHPWLPPVYDACNEWAHFTSRHVFNVWSVTDTEKGIMSGQIPLAPKSVPVRLLGELVGAMNESTQNLFGYFELWEDAKNNRPSGEEE